MLNNFLYAYDAVVNGAGGAHIIDFMTEVAGRWEFEHGPQLAPDFGQAWPRLSGFTSISKVIVLEGKLVPNEDWR